MSGTSTITDAMQATKKTPRRSNSACLVQRVTADFYRGLSNFDADKERNFQLLKERGWFDIPVV
jgi:hypothetical protein